MGKTKKKEIALKIKSEAIISEETLHKVKSLPRIDYMVYKSLIDQKQINPLKKLKRARTIFFDEETKYFLYLNPVYLKLSACGRFVDAD